MQKEVCNGDGGVQSNAYSKVMGGTATLEADHSKVMGGTATLEADRRCLGVLPAPKESAGSVGHASRSAAAAANAPMARVADAACSGGCSAGVRQRSDRGCRKGCCQACAPRIADMCMPQ